VHAEPAAATVVRMRTPRVFALALVMAALLAACGRSDEPDTDRIIASPLASDVPSTSPGATAPASSGGGAGATSGGAAATDASGTRRNTPKPTAPPNLANAKVKLTKVASIDDPVAMATRTGDSAIYVAQRHPGTIRPVRSGKVGRAVLDIGSQISTGNEQGLLGLAFSSDGKKLYVYFTSKTGSGLAGDDVLREYSFSNGRATSPRDVLRIADPEGNHNGGNVVFGPDGYLYIGPGDGGGAGDAHGVSGNGQNINVLLGKILRIDPRASGSAAYTSPKDNPFVGKDGRDEIWAYGLRNPWRFSFDRSTDDLWIGDVGQNEWEEVDYDPHSSGGGDNYGWRRMEGTHSYNGGTPPAGHHGPIYEYSHDHGCSITGGFVYRGSKIHDLKGAYVFADFCGGELEAFVQDGGRANGHRLLGPKLEQLSSFGQSASGEIYVMSLGGGLYRIDQA
jgi:glucose/arabinose dehydrogenase